MILTKKRKKFISMLSAILMVAIMVVPNTLTSHAANELVIAQYVNVNGVVTAGEQPNTGTYNGNWTASIPMGKVMSGIEPSMKQAADAGYYPHGKDGAYKIAYIEYMVTFPEGANINDDGITLANTTSMFNGAAFTKSVNGQTVSFKFPLNDVNWATIYNAYKQDGGADSTKTIDINVPYTVVANSKEEAKAAEEKTITSSGSFETHGSGTFYSWTKVVYNTDNSSQSLAPGFSTSNVFRPKEMDAAQTVDLDADLMINEDTGNNTITKQKSDKMEFVGVLDTKSIKDQMAAIENSHAGAQAANIMIENLISSFMAKLTLPRELSFSANEAILEGANGIFEIESVTLEDNEKTAAVKFNLVGADSIDTFEKLKNAINSVDDQLKVVYKSVKFNEAAEGGTSYEAIGTVKGNLTARATHTLSGNVINFDLTWNGKQSDTGKSFSNPTAIALSVKYPESTEQTVRENGNLDGDILINDDTQMDKIVTFDEKDIFKVTGTLDVTPIKEQMKAVEDRYQADQVAENIDITDMYCEFKTSIELPAGLKFVDGVENLVELRGANDKFKISQLEVENNKLTVTMVVKEEVQTFREIKDAVDGVDGTLLIDVNGVTFSEDAVANVNYTMKGEVGGVFRAKATHKLTGNVVNFRYKWEGVQVDGGEDFAYPGTDEILGTVKYSPIVVIPFEANEVLPGDLSIGDDTQNTHVYETTKDTKLNLTGSLDVRLVKNQLKEVEDRFNKSNIDPKSIKVSEYSSIFVATLTLPEELDFSDTSTAKLMYDNIKFKIISTEFNGKEVTVKMTVNADVKDYNDLKDAVESMDDVLKVTVNDVMFNEQAVENTNYTLRGTMTGNLKALATSPAGNKIRFNLSWNAEQMEGGEDFTSPESKNIAFTLKYVDKKVQPNVNVEKTKPETKKNNSPNTGDNSQVVLYSMLGLLGLVGTSLTYRKKSR